jgi:hypothetical protein
MERSCRTAHWHREHNITLAPFHATRSSNDHRPNAKATRVGGASPGHTPRIGGCARACLDGGEHEGAIVLDRVKDEELADGRTDRHDHDVRHDAGLGEEERRDLHDL